MRPLPSLPVVSGIRSRFHNADWEARFRSEQIASTCRLLQPAVLVFLALDLLVIGGAVGRHGLTLDQPIVQLCVLIGLVLAGFGLAFRLTRERPSGGLNFALAGTLVLLIYAAPPLLLGRAERPELRFSLLEFGYAGPLLFAFTSFAILRLALLPAALLNLAGITIYATVLQAVAWFPTLDRFLHVTILSFGLVLGVLSGWIIDRLMRESFVQRELLAERERDIARERERSDALLRNILPDSIAARLKAGESPIADGPLEAGILFADLTGFTPLAARLPPPAVVALLDELFSGFDAIVARHGLEKIKTVGDAYMTAAGIPLPCADPVAAVARAALEMRDLVQSLRSTDGRLPQVRIGIDAGPVVAGVIGRAKFAYDLWGDAVNTAARMESTGEPGRIHVTARVAEQLAGRFLLTPRGEVEIKGKGRMPTCWLEGEKPGSHPDPGGQPASR